ncbi:MAG: hypothetical protein ACJ76W_04030 [Chloroflexota bacterium]
MTEQSNRSMTNPARPIGPVADTADDVVDEPEQTDAGGRLGQLPEHEIDDETTVGGGVLSQGGTAVDRGTGTLWGQAEGRRPDRGDDPFSGPDDEPEEVMPPPSSHC